MLQSILDDAPLNFDLNWQYGHNLCRSILSSAALLKLKKNAVNIVHSTKLETQNREDEYQHFMRITNIFG